jgi:hypothetical protein
MLPLLILVGVLGTAFWGSATQLDIQRNSLIAGSAKVVRCDDSGVQIYWRTDWNKTSDQLLLKGVTVAGIDADCGGKSYRVVVTNKAGEKLAIAKGTVPCPAGPPSCGDTNVRVEFDKCAEFDPQEGCQPLARDVNGVHVAIHD